VTAAVIARPKGGYNNTFQNSIILSTLQSWQWRQLASTGKNEEKKEKIGNYLQSWLT
jgi:hypothetical protein